MFIVVVFPGCASEFAVGIGQDLGEISLCDFYFLPVRVDTGLENEIRIF